MREVGGRAPRVWALAITAAALSCVFCPRTAARGAVLEFGPPPPQDGAIVYQPEVVIVEGGASAIRELSRDGLTWTIDPAARRARELAPGKIMFVTGRAVGRVLAVQARPRGLAVTVGPIGLTDLFTEAEFQFDQPLDFSRAIIIEAPQFPGAAPDTRGPRLVPASYLRSSAADSVFGRFTVSPLLAPNGLGLRLSSQEGAIDVNGMVRLNLAQPRLQFVLSIHGAKLQKALLRLHGAAHFTAEVSVHNRRGKAGDFVERIYVPIDFTFLDGIPPPLAITVRQSFSVETIFQAAGHLRGVAQFSMDGAINLGYDNGQFLTGVPSLKPQVKLTDSVRGVSVGAANVILGHQAKIIVGVGGFGFAVGPYLGLTSVLTVRNGSSIGPSRHTILAAQKEACHGGMFDLTLVGGVGYAIPPVLAKGINFFITTLNQTLGTKIGEIAPDGGASIKPVNVLHHEEVEPNTRMCRDGAR